MRTVNVVISGRVQGVGYRAFVVRNANELHLTGWVRIAATEGSRPCCKAAAKQLRT